MISQISYKEIEGVLKEPDAGGVKHPYYLIKEGSQVIFVISQGKNGSEFNKTKCFFSSPANVGVYQCLYGQGIVMMQRNDEQDEAKEFKVITLSAGKQVEVPAGMVICFANVGRSFLVVLGPQVEEESDDKAVLEKQGLAYYIVEKKGEVAFEQNPHYSVHPQISTD